MADMNPDWQIVADTMDPCRAAALNVALSLDGPPVVAGDALPPFFHQVYFWQAEPAARLGRDGHPRVGAFIPDLGLPRRMWAGGRLKFPAPLIAGVSAERHSEIATVARKTGRSGPLGFVTLRHEIRQEGVLRIAEEQDLVYREEPAPDTPGAAPVFAPLDSEPERHAFSTTLLFRYSALTLNGHRIHYDADYARDVEGYAGLVVHGPLLAQLLMLKAARAAPLRGFSFRGMRPLTHVETAVLNRDGARLWVRNGAGHLVMQAEAEW
ncbi:FAS1-like dehydratase domain-containing protein [Tropicimonas sp.]|uniref:FAS1-like dehydratase domain-containing protein n=1 Tax=Tropicimonas sp. TaxID=2067044 RepID=UPI003A8B869C